MQYKTLNLLNQILVEAQQKQQKPIQRVIMDKTKVKETMEELKREITEKKKDINFKELFTIYSSFYSYSFYNCLLIHAQRSGAEFVAGFQTWRKKYNRQVNRGEKGIQILAPNRKKIVDEETDKVYYKLMGFRVVYVFDITQTSQIEGKKVIITESGTPLQKPEKEQLRLLEEFNITFTNFIENEKIPLIYISEERIGLAKGMTEGKHIYIKKEIPFYEQFFAKIHEWVHFTLHFTRDTKTNIIRPNSKYSRERMELEAETVLYIVAKHFGLKTGSIEYLASWQKKEDIMESLQNVHGLSRIIIQVLEESKVIKDSIGD